MDCDRCGRAIEGGPLVSIGPGRQFLNLCRTCWAQETRNSNARLIDALNEMTREEAEEAGGQARTPSGKPKKAARGRGAKGRRHGGQEHAVRPDRRARGTEASPPEQRARRSRPERPATDAEIGEGTDSGNQERRSDPDRTDWHP